MEKGDWVDTPRFCKVQIEKVFKNQQNAIKAGFTEPTYYRDYEYGVVGKSISQYEMVFAAYKK